jgi:HAD superfamily hydrolase (TIGR01509 family)
LIIDTETPDYSSWQETFTSYQVTLDRALWAGFIGGASGTFDVYRHLEDLVDAPLDRDSLRASRRKRYLDLVEANPVRPGVEEYLEEAKRLDLRLGIASSSSRDWVEGHLKNRGLLGYFDQVVCRDDVTRVKPDPEVYLKCANRLGAHPGVTLAIEDSANGVTAAKAAGMFCIVVPNPMTTDMDLGHADLNLVALTDMPLKAVLAAAAHGQAT